MASANTSSTAPASTAPPFEELAAGIAVDFSVSDNHGGDEPGEHPRAVNVRLAEDVMPAEDNEPLPREKLSDAR